MVKFMQSVGDKMLELLETEAKMRDVTTEACPRDHHTRMDRSPREKRHAVPPISTTNFYHFVLSACKAYDILPTIDR